MIRNCQVKSIGIGSADPVITWYQIDTNISNIANP